VYIDVYMLVQAGLSVIMDQAVELSNFTKKLSSVAFSLHLSKKISSIYCSVHDLIEGALKRFEQLGVVACSKLIKVKEYRQLLPVDPEVLKAVSRAFDELPMGKL
jgi:hypothetical protein